MTPAEITDAVLEADKYREKIDVIDEALWDERRQTQRRMIAALYWQLGEAYLEADRFFAGSRPWERRMDAAAPILNAARRLAQAMEAACQR